MKLKDKLKNKDNANRFKFLYRTAELLRLEYNIAGKKFRDDVISENEWNIYKANFFKRQRKVLHEANLIKDMLDLYHPLKQKDMQKIEEGGKNAIELDIEIDIINIEL